MKHGTIIKKLNIWTWDNYLVAILNVAVSITLGYGIYTMSTSLSEDPEVVRRRNYLEEVLTGRRRKKTKAGDPAKGKTEFVNYEAHPELDPSGSAPMPKGWYRRLNKRPQLAVQ